MGVHEIEELVALVRAYSSESHYIGPRDPTLVDAAETRLNVVFPPSYRRFLLEFGALSVGGAEIFGITDGDWEHGSAPDTVWVTASKRRHSTPPGSLVFVYAIGDGSYYAIETSRKGTDNESPIVFWEPGDEEVDKLEVTDADFGSFALRKITEAILRLEKRRQL